MSAIILIRPGCTDYDDQKRIQGTLDLPLNERGEEQVQELVEQLHDLPLEAIYTSNAEPAKSTAEAIGDSLSVPVKSHEGLGNLNQGLWQGLCDDEIRRKFPKVYKQWHESPETVCPPEGEMVSAALERVARVLQKPLKRYKLFAVVASEPLATLITCLVGNRRVEVPEPADDTGGSQTIQILDAPEMLSGDRKSAAGSSGDPDARRSQPVHAASGQPHSTQNGDQSG